MNLDARVVTDEEARHFIDTGLWVNRSLTAEMRRVAAEDPTREIIIDRFGRFTYGEISALVDRLAASFSEMGLEKGKRVAVQLPNWHIFPVIHLALEALGVVIVPLPTIYRAKEVGFILGFTGAEMVVVPSTFRGFDHVAMIDELRPQLPDLKHAVVVGAETPKKGWIPYESLIAARNPQPVVRLVGDPCDVTEIAFTSGSTGEPKGVMASSNSLAADGQTIADACGLTSRDTFFMPSTLGHQLGFSQGVRLPIALGAKVVYQDVWNAEAAVELLARERVTYTCLTPTFLFDILKAPNLLAHDRLPHLRVWLVAGAVATSALHDEVHAVMPHLSLAHVFSMTEVGAVIIHPPNPPAEKALATGRCPAGVRLKVIDENGAPVPTDCEGELVIRSHSFFAGYFRRPEVTEASFTADGFFRSGDRVRLDADGYYYVTGRIKDLIKRGGESISPAEIEEALVDHPKISDAAVVGLPDERLGEKVCVFVIAKTGETITLDEVIAWVAKAGMAKQKWPEQLEVVKDFPRTSIGKVHKGMLRASTRNKA